MRQGGLRRGKAVDRMRFIYLQSLIGIYWGELESGLTRITRGLTFIFGGSMKGHRGCAQQS